MKIINHLNIYFFFSTWFVWTPQLLSRWKHDRSSILLDCFLHTMFLNIPKEMGFRNICRNSFYILYVSAKKFWRNKLFLSDIKLLNKWNGFLSNNYTKMITHFLFSSFLVLHWDICTGFWPHRKNLIHIRSQENFFIL